MILLEKIELSIDRKKSSEYRNANEKKIFHKEIHQIISSEYLWG